MAVAAVIHVLSAIFAKNVIVTGSKIRLNAVYSFLHVAASTSYINGANCRFR